MAQKGGKIFQRPFSQSVWLLLLLLFSGCDGNTAVPPTPLNNEISSNGTPDATPTLSDLATAVNTPQTEVTGDATAVIATVTPFPTPSPTPFPQERVTLGNQEIQYGNFDAAIDQFEKGIDSGALDANQITESQLGLAVAQFEEGQYEEAIPLLEALAETFPNAYFYLAQSHAALGNHAEALTAYEQFIGAEPSLTAYITPLMADAHFALGNQEEGIALLNTAVTAPSHYLTEVENRQRLIAIYQANNDLPNLIAQYDAIFALAQTPYTQAQMLYQAGLAELALGADTAAYDRFGRAVVNYPAIYETYLGLVQLVEAGVPVNEYQRGLVNYFARSYQPCVGAFNRYLASAPDPLLDSAYLYLAYCYEGLGNLNEAAAALESYAQTQPADALAEAAQMWNRAGLTEDFETTAVLYLNQYPDGEDAVELLWQTAVSAASRGATEVAIERYTRLAEEYSWHEDAPEALFRAGWLANSAGDAETAVQLWDIALTQHPNTTYGDAATVWQLKTLPTVTQTLTVTTPTELTAGILEDTAVSFYALRAEALAHNKEPFDTEAPFELPTPAETAQLQREAEQWLAEWLGLESSEGIGELSSALRTDPALIRGEALWEIGLLELAKRELESVRVAHGNDALASYQLALYFRELGLYRSSIWAATAVLNNSGQSIREAPLFLGRLIYPVYYSDLIMPLAEQYGYDPRLQFALVRQESLFESFARSGAAAQGLSQVIPDTGAYIATQLNWPNYKNEDLYKPYVGLTFGAFYLAQQLGFFDGDVHAALAAYNAGPGNAARWHDTAASDIDLYYQTVNFGETRQYISRIYTGYEIYRFLYNPES